MKRDSQPTVSHIDKSANKSPGPRKRSALILKLAHQCFWHLLAATALPKVSRVLLVTPSRNTSTASLVQHWISSGWNPFLGDVRSRKGSFSVCLRVERRYRADAVCGWNLEGDALAPRIRKASTAVRRARLSCCVAIRLSASRKRRFQTPAAYRPSTGITVGPRRVSDRRLIRRSKVLSGGQLSL
jgi:hypothetical protein